MNDTSSKQTCIGCRFLDTSKRRCRRAAPVADQQNSHAAVWPIVNPNEDWCGKRETSGGRPEEPRQPKFDPLSQSIYELSLSQRMIERLGRSSPDGKEILTIGQLVEIGPRRLMQVRGIGHCTMHQLNKALNKLGVHWGSKAP